MRTEDCAHKWKQIMHLDSCHTFTDTYECSGCTSTAIVHTEREPLMDVNARMFMEPEACPRCRSLADGAPVVSHIVMQSAEGTILKEFSIEREQREEGE